jgi:hypothetical protein
MRSRRNRLGGIKYTTAWFESDSENSDHGELRSYTEMYTPDMLGPDGKPKNGGPQRLSAVQVTALRAAAKCLTDSKAPNTIELRRGLRRDDRGPANE